MQSRVDSQHEFPYHTIPGLETVSYQDGVDLRFFSLMGHGTTDREIPGYYKRS